MGLTIFAVGVPPIGAAGPLDDILGDEGLDDVGLHHVVAHRRQKPVPPTRGPAPIVTVTEALGDSVAGLARGWPQLLGVHRALEADMQPGDLALGDCAERLPLNTDIQRSLLRSGVFQRHATAFCDRD
ncbi:hypothetical protein PQ455_16120 [Sphingomonas naphthae]|uniref:Uncharacterized protein n=1 Tax=Sphingomonas naphthae TaxID=1813468 RepID=A0ABY7TMQ9_9SPHN|nr:hypothetical protein [Sphingomonas naphthae]WCT73134.1 hypothetical protein PQ455_16120 [Sphingomonas naphthae]